MRQVCVWIKKPSVLQAMIISFFSDFVCKYIFSLLTYSFLSNLGIVLAIGERLKHVQCSFDFCQLNELKKLQVVCKATYS